MPTRRPAAGTASCLPAAPEAAAATLGRVDWLGLYWQVCGRFVHCVKPSVDPWHLPLCAAAQPCLLPIALLLRCCKLKFHAVSSQKTMKSSVNDREKSSGDGGLLTGTCIIMHAGIPAQLRLPQCPEDSRGLVLLRPPGTPLRRRHCPCTPLAAPPPSSSSEHRLCHTLASCCGRTAPSWRGGVQVSQLGRHVCGSTIKCSFPGPQAGCAAGLCCSHTGADGSEPCLLHPLPPTPTCWHVPRPWPGARAQYRLG